MKITPQISNTISSSITSGVFKVNDNKKIITVFPAGKNVEALVVKNGEIRNVSYTGNVKEANALYDAYKKDQDSKPIRDRTVHGYDGSGEPAAKKAKKDIFGITNDLSDPNRPNDIASALSSLYDDEWSETMENLSDQYPNMSETEALTILFDSLMTSYDVCKKNPSLESADKTNMILKGISGVYNSFHDLYKTIKTYVKNCTHICTAMFQQSPPMTFGKIPEKNNVFPTDDYKEYSAHGSTVDYVVWPPLYQHEGGPKMLKGVAQPINTKKTTTSFNETDQQILNLMKETESLEERILKTGNTYDYPLAKPNPENTNPASRMAYWRKRHDTTRTELSKFAGHQLIDGNPRITDYSDPNRPMKVAEKYSELYDNEWTDMLDACLKNNDNFTEKKSAALSFQSLMIANQVCQNNPALALDAKEAMILKEIKSTFNNVNIPDNVIKSYVKKCTYVCTYMLAQKPPMVFGEIPQTGNDFPEGDYTPYNGNNGPKVDHVVWPPLYLNKNGRLLFNGIAKSSGVTTKTKTDFIETNEKVLEQVAEVKTLEARIAKMGGTYEYQVPNPGDTDLNTRLGYWKKRVDATLSETSKYAGDKLRAGNHDITDLSDKNRPLKISESLENIYNNHGFDPITEIESNNPYLKGTEQSTVILFRSLMTAYEVCKNHKESKIDAQEAMILQKLQEEFHPIKIFGDELKSYISKCTNTCTAMLTQTPPMVFGKTPDRNSDFIKKHYREYTAAGTKVDYMIWPVLYRSEDGSILSKGVVQPMSTEKTEKTKTDFTETDNTVIKIMNKAIEDEAIIASKGIKYEYSLPRPDSANLQERTDYWTKRQHAALIERSKTAGSKTYDSNPDISDLRDTNRPMMVGMQFSKLYDDQWTDASEDIMENNKSLTDEQKTQILFSSIKTTHDICKNNTSLSSNNKEEMILNELKKEFNSADLSGDGIKEYIKESTIICTRMLSHTPPLTFGKIPKKGDDFSKELYTQYDATGTKVDYMVFPILHMYDGGPVLTRGVVQSIRAKK
ncbi:MAG: hypothetical protein QS748_02945 [Candidatus Endonucleobacter bathymodioli]|uniref:Mitochondria-eating protein C-terminal domain-containing protein n=1 Tax=Candidatus Endonucleibacter bathymodioli TaxID=539814 RepID=A0AA90NU00_9GAMM|nr:hypothetical protein [Candidatus Endonucleobacter bathymodioli]